MVETTNMMSKNQSLLQINGDTLTSFSFSKPLILSIIWKIEFNISKERFGYPDESFDLRERWLR